LRNSPHAEGLRRCGFADDYRGLAAEINDSSSAGNAQR